METTVNIAQRVEDLDWSQIYRDFDERGYAKTPRILSEDECEELKDLFGEQNRFRSVIDMRRLRFGSGVYKYFDNPVPWANTTVLSGDVAAAIGELKAEPGGELQVHGSGVLIRWLLANDLVEEINLLIVPVVVGQGARLFPDSGPDLALELVESRATASGVTIQVYRTAGRPQYG
jgi:hypothetical protein